MPNPATGGTVIENLVDPGRTTLLLADSGSTGAARHLAEDFSIATWCWRESGRVGRLWNRFSIAPDVITLGAFRIPESGVWELTTASNPWARHQLDPVLGCRRLFPGTFGLFDLQALGFEIDGMFPGLVVVSELQSMAGVVEMRLTEQADATALARNLSGWAGGTGAGIVVSIPGAVRLHPAFTASFHRIMLLTTHEDGAGITGTITDGAGEPIDSVELWIEPFAGTITGVRSPCTAVIPWTANELSAGEGGNGLVTDVADLAPESPDLP